MVYAADRPALGQGLGRIVISARLVNGSPNAGVMLDLRGSRRHGSSAAPALFRRQGHDHGHGRPRALLINFSAAKRPEPSRL